MKTMKKIIFLSVIIGAITLSSCSHHHYHVHKKGIPPGHAKKMTGSKSAKAYAPGQRKKH
jgi:hypothetical protein